MERLCDARRGSALEGWRHAGEWLTDLVEVLHWFCHEHTVSGDVEVRGAATGTGATTLALWSFVKSR